MKHAYLVSSTECIVIIDNMDYHRRCNHVILKFVCTNISFCNLKYFDIMSINIIYILHMGFQLNNA